MSAVQSLLATRFVATCWLATVHQKEGSNNHCVKPYVGLHRLARHQRRRLADRQAEREALALYGSGEEAVSIAVGHGGLGGFETNGIELGCW